MSSRFDPEFYSLFRPFYPAQTFTGIAERLSSRGFTSPFQVVDIGCGTGHSTLSFIQSCPGMNVTGIDSDPHMLEEAERIAPPGSAITWKCSAAEATGLDSHAFDLILIGSAFHWMKPTETREEILRILKPRGVIRVFEYQFPKALKLPELNEWIRREFNLRWKAPDQKPRGSLKDLTKIFRDDDRFEYLAEGQPEMLLTLDVNQLTGLILSQSRVLHYEDMLDEDERESFREALKVQISVLMENQPAVFDFKLSWIEFGISKAG